MRDGVKPLLGETPDKELQEYLKNTCNSILDMPANVHHVHLHRYGRHMELTFHLELPADLSLKSAHGLVTRIERRIKKERQIEATIHMEPKR